MAPSLKLTDALVPILDFALQALKRDMASTGTARQHRVFADVYVHRLFVVQHDDDLNAAARDLHPVPLALGLAMFFVAVTAL